jgi:hypothetical protein
MRTFLDVLHNFPLAQHLLIAGSQCWPTGQQTGSVPGPNAKQRRSPAQQSPPRHSSSPKQSSSPAQERSAATHLRGFLGLGRAQT